MAKLKNVTEAEISALTERAEILLASLHDVTNRIEKSYCDDLQNPVSAARTFAVVSRAAADLTVHLLARNAMQEQKRDIERMLKERDSK